MTSQSPPERLNRASNEILEATSFLFGANAAFIESLYAQYLQNPEAVDPSWAAYFAGLGQSGLTPAQVGRGPSWVRDSKPERAKSDLIGALSGAPSAKPAATAGEKDLRIAAQESIRAIQLVRAYRVIGHLEADLDPLELAPKTPHPAARPELLRLPRGRTRQADLHRRRDGHGKRHAAAHGRNSQAHLLRAHRL